jgi:hypothetical protein
VARQEAQGQGSRGQGMAFPLLCKSRYAPLMPCGARYTRTRPPTETSTRLIGRVPPDGGRLTPASAQLHRHRRGELW